MSYLLKGTQHQGAFPVQLMWVGQSMGKAGVPSCATEDPSPTLSCPWREQLPRSWCEPRRFLSHKPLSACFPEGFLRWKAEVRGWRAGLRCGLCWSPCRESSSEGVCLSHRRPEVILSKVAY